MNFTPYEHAVAGHEDTILTEASGEIIVKTCIQSEKDFYLKTGPALDSDFVGVWTPKFYGSLDVVGKEDNSIPDAEIPKNSIVMENLTYQFKRPCIMDIKLGIQLWSAEASVEKIQRMTERSANTTSGTTGLRIAGFKVWDSQENQSLITPKSYGLSINPDELHEGIARFFPTHNSPILAAKLGSPASSRGINELLMVDLLERIIEDIEQIKAKTSAFNWLAIASSMLIVYEGDEECLENALQKQKEAGRVSAAADSPDVDTSDDDDDDDDIPLGGSVSHRVRLIDFAHTVSRPGEGPDKGFNLGMETLARLINKRLEDVKEILK